MRQLQLPLYGPYPVAPERAVITLLHAALCVTERVLRHEHPVDIVPKLDQHHAPLVIAAARLVVDRCAELRTLLHFYDDAVDDVLRPDDDEIPF